ncbi:MAG: hypothetical protein IPK52_00345 [Chloroflexi bacterium]|nr:hypothetical protein [Chloroflexota bacterium]
MKTLSTGALFTDVLAAAAREGYPGTVTYEGINYKTIKVGTSYQFRQISYPAPAYETYEVSTADATATVIAEWDVAEAEQVTVEVLVQGHKSNYADGLSSFVVAGRYALPVATSKLRVRLRRSRSKTVRARLPSRSPRIPPTSVFRSRWPVSLPRRGTGRRVRWSPAARRNPCASTKTILNTSAWSQRSMRKVTPHPTTGRCEVDLVHR